MHSKEAVGHPLKLNEVDDVLARADARRDVEMPKVWSLRSQVRASALVSQHTYARNASQDRGEAKRARRGGLDPFATTDRLEPRASPAPASRASYPTAHRRYLLGWRRVRGCRRPTSPTPVVDKVDALPHADRRDYDHVQYGVNQCIRHRGMRRYTNLNSSCLCAQHRVASAVASSTKNSIFSIPGEGLPATAAQRPGTMQGIGGCS